MQFSKKGKIWEQLFHAWTTLHFDENIETIYVSVQRIMQVATMLNYGEQQILVVFIKHCHYVCIGYYSQLIT